MELPSLQELEPYLSLAAASLGVVTLGFVLKLTSSMRQAARDRAEIIEERLKNTVADLERTEKWSARDKEQLIKENQQLETRLEKALTESGMTVEALAMGQTLENATDAIQTAISELVARMESVDHNTPSITDGNWHLQLAKGHMAQKQWAKAAIHFDKYCDVDPANSDIQFSRGVAHANVRGGKGSNVSALRAYNEAIAFLGENVGASRRARYFVYRGAMLKRLRRLDEAHRDLEIALQYADREFEINDARYNLACVYAMLGDREKMMDMVRLLRGCHRELKGIRLHLNDYFQNFADDKELLESLRGV